MAAYSFPIEKPTLLLDEVRARANLARMTEKAGRTGVRFRPHFKTHQSHEIGRWFRERGISAITVSSLDMALYFAEDGWGDITVAFPANPREAEKIEHLARKIDLSILVDQEETLALLASRLRTPVSVWIKVDCGYGRVGIPWDQTEKILCLIQTITDRAPFRFRGLLTHFGQTYHAGFPAEVRRIYEEALGRLHRVREACTAKGVQDFDLSIGDTPSCSLADEFPGVNEIRPGNFIFYDLTQEQVGACSDRDIAVAVACPIVGVFPDRRQIAIYGGAVHFSKEALVGQDGKPVYGFLAESTAQGWRKNEAVVLTSLSQEHGLLTVTDDSIDKFEIGEVVTIFPVHSCLTANLYHSYVTLDGRKIPRFRSLF